MSKFAPHRKSYNNPRATATTVCQRCLQTGHFIYECKSERPYVSRPSRTEMLENTKTLGKAKAEGKPSVEVPEEFKKKSGTANLILEAKEKERGKQKAGSLDGHPKKKARRSSHSSTSESSRSDSGSDSDSDSESSSSVSDSDSRSSSGSESLRSRERNRRRRVPRRYDSRSRSTSSSRVSDSSDGRD